MRDGQNFDKSHIDDVVILPHVEPTMKMHGNNKTLWLNKCLPARAGGNERLLWVALLECED